MPAVGFDVPGRGLQYTDERIVQPRLAAKTPASSKAMSIASAPPHPTLDDAHAALTALDHVTYCLRQRVHSLRRGHHIIPGQSVGWEEVGLKVWVCRHQIFEG
jgi:hypothetical protein